jgi:hypothetical protein
MTAKNKRWPRAGLVLVFMGASLIAAWHFRTFIRGSLFAICDFASYREAYVSPIAPVEEKLVAHAGGAVNGVPYTNSREALDQHYAAGYRVFELDFDWTSDGRLVVVHDWASTSSSFGAAPHVFSDAEFVSATRRDGLHQMTFEDLQQWLRAHPDAFVVTDTKESNLWLLAWLRANASEILPQLILQVYRASEIQPAGQLGPRAVWFTVYKYSYPPWALSRISGVDAFVIPVGAYGQYRKIILAGKARFYVHSVSAKQVDEAFRRLPGIYGIYVD